MFFNQSIFIHFHVSSIPYTSSSPKESLWLCVAKYRGLLYAGVNIHSSLTNVFVARGLTCDWHRIEFMNICRGAGPRGIMAAPILPIMPIHTHPQSSTTPPPPLSTPHQPPSTGVHWPYLEQWRRQRTLIDPNSRRVPFSKTHNVGMGTLYNEERAAVGLVAPTNLAANDICLIRRSLSHLESVCTWHCYNMILFDNKNLAQTEVLSNLNRE